MLGEVDAAVAETQLGPRAKEDSAAEHEVPNEGLKVGSMPCMHHRRCGQLARPQPVAQYLAAVTCRRRGAAQALNPSLHTVGNCCPRRLSAS